MRMPEEINRRLTDHCSTMLSAPTENCVKNLVREGVDREQIYLTGDTMYDALLRHLPKSSKSTILETLSLEAHEYAVLTVHRPENVDHPQTLASILEAMLQLKELPTVFPAHPRTLERLETAGLLKKLRESDHLRLVQPVGYHDMLRLVKDAKMVFTDSGGLPKEAFWLHTVCLTLRETTEWVETVELEANVLVGNDRDRIIQNARKCRAQERLVGTLKQLPNPFGDGRASVGIVKALKEGRWH